MEEVKIKKVDFYYYNDKDIPVAVAVKDMYTTITVLPQKIAKFTLDMPENCDILIKEWTNSIILITYINKGAIK